MEDFKIKLIILEELDNLRKKHKSERIKVAYANRKKKWGRNPIPPNKKKKILEQIDKGISYRNISKKEGIAISTISKISNEKRYK